MELTKQTKLTRAEWENIEIPVSAKEKQILQMIIAGYHNINIHTNENQSLFSFVKIENNETTELFLFKKYMIFFQMLIFYQNRKIKNPVHLKNALKYFESKRPKRQSVQKRTLGRTLNS
jgi:hypothetical protein